MVSKSWTTRLGDGFRLLFSPCQFIYGAIGVNKKFLGNKTKNFIFSNRKSVIIFEIFRIFPAFFVLHDVAANGYQQPAAS